MDSPEERLELGSRGREWVENNHGWPGVWERYERVLATATR
jgi:hypothetical protein